MTSPRALGAQGQGTSILFHSATGEAGENAAMDIRDYSLIQRPSQIKRASRHVPLINILDQ
jgi:hypothetical protein